MVKKYPNSIPRTPHSHTLTDHETAVMHRLQEVILERAGALISVMDLSAELDWWASRLVLYIYTKLKLFSCMLRVPASTN